MRRRAEHRDHVWSYDFVFDRTVDGRPLRLLPIVDEYTRECLSIDVGRRLNSEHVLDPLGQPDPGRPASKVVGDHLDREPGAIGGEATRGQVIEPDAVLEVTDRVLDLGVATMVARLAELFVRRGVPGHIRSDIQTRCCPPGAWLDRPAA